MKKTVTLKDKTFEVMIPAHEIDQAVTAVAERLNADYKEKKCPIFIGVLNGAFMFMSDLIKKVDFECELSFVKLASYAGTTSTGKVECLLGLNNSLEGRDVIIVEDIVDTGRSIARMFADIEKKNPASIEVCTLFFKPASYSGTLPIRYRALEIGNEFIVGYGLDYDQLGRNLEDIYVVTND
jgi:hypoxanthine phosphoribosyltransferase